MEQTSFNPRRDRHGKDNSICTRNSDGDLLENSDLCLSKSILNRSNKRLTMPHALYLKLKQYRTGKFFIPDSFFSYNIGLDYKIPKCMMTIDEKYLRRCLELIQISAVKSARCNISINFASLKTAALPESLNLNTSKLRDREMGDLDRFVIACPSPAGDGNAVISPGKLWFIGSIMESKSMINILKSPLLHQFGISDGASNLMRMNLSGIKGSDFIDAHDDLDVSSLKKLENKKSTMGSHQNGSETTNERFFSTPSRNSQCSDQSSSGSASSTPLSQGMLQFTWKEGSPHFIFSLDDEKEVYVASSWKIKSVDNKALDYIYSFQSVKSGLIIGKMKISTSFSLGPNNSKIANTEYVLFGGLENSNIEMHTSTSNIKKNKAFPRKVADVFRTSNSSKPRSMSNFGKPGVIKDYCPWEPSSEKLTNAGGLPNDLPPNLELAAIVVRDHLPEDRGNKVGGWGLKFLKQTKDSCETSVMSESCTRNSGNCSTSMDILIPAGLHGGPRSNGGPGPSSLLERWRSGGLCDCGGWDMGCPLTVLTGQSTDEDTLSRSDPQECRAFNIHPQGSGNGPPTLRMVNIRDGLYFVHFLQPKLKFLQSFSIAVAIVHSRNPALRPRNVQELK